jgi:AbiV family abortive infection protein
LVGDHDIIVTHLYENDSHMITPALVTPQYLLKGAFYALEQCGLLLRDAVRLSNGGSHASALVLAAFAREELGREGILLKLRGECISGGRITVETIKDKCDDHKIKQKYGMLSTTLMADRDTVMGRLLQTKIRAHPHSPEWKEADAKLRQMDKGKGKKTPADRHKKRELSLYVDPVSEDTWNRPTTTSPADAQLFVMEAVNDYAGKYERRVSADAYGSPLDIEIFEALKGWADRPELPQPEWPERF